MEREERCEIETSSTRGARSGSSTTWNLKQGVQVWSGNMGLIDGSWGALAKIEREEGERGQGGEESMLRSDYSGSNIRVDSGIPHTRARSNRT
jgi:hypothetical protein